VALTGAISRLEGEFGWRFCGGWRVYDVISTTKRSEETVSLNFDKETLEIPCANCKKTIKTTIGEAKRDPSLICPACGTANKIDASQFRDEEKKVQKQLDDLLKGFGKR
jgi:DNA-directed RNA polymerase subunit RPC12/RpoP